MSETTALPLPKDAEEFLRTIVGLYLCGWRDESFAEWAATKATLTLERYGLLY